MILTKNKYYILRVGNFGTNANTKLYYCFFTILLCIEEYITVNRIDCYIIMRNSTILWSIIEFFLHISKTRIIKPMNLHIMNTEIQLPMYIGIFLQGFQEGGCITTIGLYFGDRIHIFKYGVFLHLMILFIVWNVWNRELTKQVSSKRLVNSDSSLILMGSITVYDIIKLYQNPQYIKRAFFMFFIMLYVSSCWTCITWYRGFRKVNAYEYQYEISNTSTNTNTNANIYIKKNNKYNIFFVLFYDVFFEIGMAYLFFFCYYIPDRIDTNLIDYSVNN